MPQVREPVCYDGAGGLWHGAGWTFVIWGALHGLYLVINHAWRARGIGWVGMRLAVEAAWRAWALTFVAVVVGWVFFRASSVEAAIGLLKGMAGFNGITLPAAIMASLAAIRPLLDHLASARVLAEARIS